MPSPTSSIPKSHHTHNGFRNPWPAPNSLSSYLQIPITRSRHSTKSASIKPVKTVPCDLRPYFSEETETKGIHATWLGHAGFLVQIAQTRILFDPILAERASPVTWAGPKRYLPIPCEAKDLPRIHFTKLKKGVATSYDHLDIECLRQVRLKSPNVRFLVPLRVKQTLLDELGLNEDEEGEVTEMDWWESSFKEIGERYGPFDLAMIPIWRGASLSILGRWGLRLTEAATSLLATLHATPSDAVQLYQDVKAKRAIAMHFGTFCGSEDEAKEPIELLTRDLEKKGIPLLRASWDLEGFGYVDVGETVFVPV
ncbi:hypothetical protein EIP91_008585 [Steccherinum ochraceum]|uniref:Metallo-beta-lactamase domain-containing protein n=1 Tax=Steccherinum ochraceum TaxID=92696 RepID=A0A4R0RG34_9APHY|nr:hypothetical protein EIP91_008585 [Steccherinum ochraceum]